ncbi:hypothetical protein C8R45DRAFT_996791 [Mycena sanguinolenta]|nr:hypothetical protein C8R45DRAFT_996791 [Mycena sanguinolenta]
MSLTRPVLTRRARMVRLALLTKLFAPPFWKLSKTRHKSLVVVPTAVASMSSWNVCAAWSLRCSASTWPYATFNSGCVASGREDAECIFVPWFRNESNGTLALVLPPCSALISKYT